jgi:hypothetical protein
MSNGAVVSAISDVLKYRYLGPIRSQLNNEVLITQILNLDSKNIDLTGLSAYVPLQYGRNSGVGARPEMGTLPTAGSQAYKHVNFDLAYLYGRAQFSGQAIQKTKDDAGAFVRVITSEMEGLRKDLTLDVARQFYGDGTAAIATVSGAGAASATQTLSSSEALDKGFIDLNMVVDIGTVANPTSVSSGRTVIDVDPIAGTITLDQSVTTTTGSQFFRTGNAGASASYEVTGLQAMITTANSALGGIDGTAAGNKWWNNQFDNTGGAIALSNLMLDWNKVHARGLRSDNAVVLTTPGLARRLFATSDFTSNVRFVNTQTLKGGFESISFTAGSGTLNMVTDRLAPYGKVFFIDKSALQVYSPGDWDYLSRDGLTIRWVQNVDAFQAILFRYVNLGINERRTSLVMSGLTDTGF